LVLALKSRFGGHGREESAQVRDPGLIFGLDTFVIHARITMSDAVSQADRLAKAHGQSPIDRFMVGEPG